MNRWIDDVLCRDIKKATNIADDYAKRIGKMAVIHDINGNYVTYSDEHGITVRDSKNIKIDDNGIVSKQERGKLAWLYYEDKYGFETFVVFTNDIRVLFYITDKESD